MTELFLITFVAFAAVMIAMAVGVLIKGKRLQGSCGGLGKVIGEDCMFCDKKEECKAEAEHDDCGSECAPTIKIDADRAYLSH